MSIELSLKPARQYDPKWIAYAKAHKRNPLGMMLHDKRKHPKDPMKGYTLWAFNKFEEWCESKELPDEVELTDDVIEEFEKWLITPEPDSKNNL